MLKRSELLRELELRLRFKPSHEELEKAREEGFKLGLETAYKNMEEEEAKKKE